MKKYIILFLGLMALSVSAQTNEELNVYDYWKYYGDMSNNLYKQLYSVAAKQIADRKKEVSNLKTPEDWQNYQAGMRQKLQRFFGTFPDKTPLNPVVTGVIKKDGFTVEKLYFESRPGYYVTAALFLPTNVKGKKPAILYCCGHSVAGFRWEGYQQYALNLVKKGFVVLLCDPVGLGERVQYFDGNGARRFPPCHEHSYPGVQSFLAGRSPAHYFVWDGIRAIDYLVSRKEVDPQRIGVTGLSGGGTQTAYLSAMDDRVAVSATECYLTTFDMLFRSRGPQDAEQVLLHSIREGYDMSDLIAVRAPKPALMVTTTRDIFSIQGARDMFREMQPVYAAFGQEENFRMVEDDAEHDCTVKNREALYAFFQKHLRNPGSPKHDEHVALFDEKELWVTPGGQIQSFRPSETLFSLNKQYVDQRLEEVHVRRRDYPAFLATLREKVIEASGYQAPEITDATIFSGRLRYEKYSVEKYLVKAPGDYYLPLLRLVPEEKKHPQLVLLLDEKGKNAAVTEGLAGRLAQEGYEVVAPDLSDIGELGGGYKSGDSWIQGVPLNVWFAGVLTQKAPVALRVEELVAVTGFIKGTDGYTGGITGIACGTLYSDLLHAAVIGRYFEKIALVRPLTGWQSIVQEREYRTKFVPSAVPGAIGLYDLPDLVAAVAPSKVLLVNPVNALDEPVSRSVCDSVYAHAKERFEQAGRLPDFTVSVEQTDDFAEVIRRMH